MVLTEVERAIVNILWHSMYGGIITTIQNSETLRMLVFQLTQKGSLPLLSSAASLVMSR